MKTEQIRDRQYRDCMSTLPDVRTSESVTIGILRDINVRLQKQISTQDDTIYGLVNEIDELDRRLAARKEQTDFLEVRVVDCIAELVASERTNQITEQAIKSAERALVEKDNLISELEKKDRHRRWLDDVSEYVIKSMTGLANGNQMKIDELETKLADRERRFDVLDGALDKTRGLLHVAENYIREQNVRIAQLESDRDNESDKQRHIVDRWDFHVGDKVTSTNCAKQSEGIDISGVVVEIDRSILYVYVNDDGVRLVNKVWMKKV